MSRSFALSLRRLLALVAVASLLLAACGDDDDSDTTGDEDASDTTGDDAPVDGDPLVVCSDIPYSPFEYEAEDGDGYTGFDVEVVEALGAELGRPVEFKDSVFDTILASVAAGDCEMVASAMTITEERQEQALFSDPYFDADQSLLVRADDADSITGIADLAGKTIGVQTGTTGETYANENAPDGAEVRNYEGGEDLFLPLLSGDLDAVLQDLPVNNFRATQGDEFVVVDAFPTGEQYGFAFALDNAELHEAINEALAAIRADGTYDAIYESYFGSGE